MKSCLEVMIKTIFVVGCAVLWLASPLIEDAFKAASYFLLNLKKYKFQPQKLLIDISEKNETKAMHRITFRESNGVNG